MALGGAGFYNKRIVAANNIDLTGASEPDETMISDGQMMIAHTVLNADGSHINIGKITSPNGTITVGYNNPNITLDLAGGSSAIERIALQSGVSPIVPAGGTITFNGSVVAAGTNPVRTDGTGANTMAIEVQTSQAIAATDVTKIGLCNFDSAAFDVDANGFVQLNGGGIAATSFDVQANTAPGTDPVVPSATGVVSINGAAVTNHSVVLETRSRAANSYNLEIQYSTSAAATDATKSGVAHFDSARFGVDANGFVTLNGSGVAETITGDSGGALNPNSGNWNIVGLSGSKTSGSGNTLTIKSPPFSQIGASATSVLNTGEFVNAAVTRTLPVSAGLSDGDLFVYVCTTAGALIVQSVGAQKIRIGSLISAAAGTATSSNIGDSLTLRFNATDGFFYATSVIGIWTLSV